MKWVNGLTQNFREHSRMLRVLLSLGGAPSVCIDDCVEDATWMPRALNVDVVPVLELIKARRQKHSTCTGTPR